MAIEKGGVLKTRNQKDRISLNKKGFKIPDLYHDSEIRMYECLIRNAIGMSWCGIVMIFIGFIYCGVTKFEPNVLLTVCPGGIVSIMSNVMIVLINRSSDSKQAYYDKHLRQEHERKVIQLIQNEEDPELRKLLINKIM